MSRKRERKKYHPLDLQKHSVGIPLPLGGTPIFDTRLRQKNRRYLT